MAVYSFLVLFFVFNCTLVLFSRFGYNEIMKYSINTSWSTWAVTKHHKLSSYSSCFVVKKTILVINKKSQYQECPKNIEMIIKRKPRLGTEPVSALSSGWLGRNNSRCCVRFLNSTHYNSGLDESWNINTILLDLNVRPLTLSISTSVDQYIITVHDMSAYITGWTIIQVLC